MSNLSNQLVVAEREDVARGIKALLRTPLVTGRTDPDAFDVIRRRREPLTKWFDYHCGWALSVEPRRGYARLLKVRPDADATRPARRQRAGRAPFDRRRYVLLCLLAAELLPVPVITIGLLTERVAAASSADPALPGFDPAHRAERLACADALGLLESTGALEAVDGATESFVDDPAAQVLYRVDATLLDRLLAAPDSPSRAAVPADEVPRRFDELLDGLAGEGRGSAAEPGSGPAVGDGPRRTVRLRHAVLRRLFDDPVLYRDELTADESDFLASPAGRLTVHRAVEQAGFVLEERAEGLLLIDPDAIATDSTFPDDSGTANVAALLLLDPVVASPHGRSREELYGDTEELLRRFPRWAKTFSTPGGVNRLVDDAVRVLTDFALVRRTEDHRVTARPAAARYRGTDPASPATHTPEGDLR
ncbi:TIGR02678 family protein [Streptomyces sp. NPDC001922]|uniref:TIGR02678 family protein n=1 Tax=Streptomyces sp. NPDC001922 TaxID=3364624 RepID=UPI00368C7FDE